MYAQYAVALCNNGYEILPVVAGDKQPAVKDWRHKHFNAVDVPQYAHCSVGIKAGPLAILDLDITHAGVLADVLAWCARELPGRVLQRRGRTGLALVYRGGGWAKRTSAAYLDPAQPVRADGRPLLQRVEVLGEGQQLVAYGIHPDTGRPYEWVGGWGGPVDVPVAALDALSEGQVVALLAEYARLAAAHGLVLAETARAGAAGGTVRADAATWADRAATLQPLGVDDDTLRLWLGAVDPDCSRDVWLSDVGMGLHHETGGEVRGLDLWDAWSQGAPHRYPGRAALEYQWSRMGQRPYGSHVKTARWLRNEWQRTQAAQVADVSLAGVDVYMQAVAGADEATLRREVIPAIAADWSIDDIDRNKLAAMVQQRFKDWLVPLGIAQARGLLRPVVVQGGADSAPDWLQRYVYVSTEDKFFHLDKRVMLTQRGFAGQHNRDMTPVGEQRPDAVVGALERWRVPVVDGLMYLPSAGETFTHDHRTYANLYSPASAPAPEPVVEAADGIERFKRHVWELVGHREGVYHNLMSWIAHNVQRPGVKIPWAPIIKGVQGDGKSTIANVLQATMGVSNVFMLASDVLLTPYNDYVHGTAIVAVEEMMLSGKDRYTVANKIKTPVSNTTISVHPKGRPVFTAANTANWIAFSNFSDPVPLDEGDRRYMIVFTPFSEIGDYERALGIAPGCIVRDWFHGMHDSMQRWPGQWRAWWLAYPIHPEFDPGGRAPMTAERSHMVAASREDEEIMAADIIARGAYGVSRDVVSTRCLTNAMIMQNIDHDEIPKGKNVKFMMAKLGFIKINRVFKWDNASHRIWLKPGIKDDNDTIRELLDLTKLHNYG